MPLYADSVRFALKQKPSSLYCNVISMTRKKSGSDVPKDLFLILLRQYLQCVCVQSPAVLFYWEHPGNKILS